MNSGDTVSERPWGNFVKLYQEKGVWVKRVSVDPGARLSLQVHHRRSEKWIVVSGEGVAIINGQDIPVAPGKIVDVPVETEHRIASTGKTKLIFIEVACGDYLGEDDITRIQDDYAHDRG